MSVSDTRQGGSVALPYLIRQTGGPRFIAPDRRKPPPGHVGKGVGKGPRGGPLFVDDVDDTDDSRDDGDDGILPATGGGAVVLGLGMIAAGLVLRRRARLQE